MADHDLAIISSIVIFFSSLTFLISVMPSTYPSQFITVGNLAWYGGGTLVIAGVCVIATGLGCAGALAVYSVASILATWITNSTFAWFSTLILTPLSIILAIYLAKLGRGQ